MVQGRMSVLGVNVANISARLTSIYGSLSLTDSSQPSLSQPSLTLQSFPYGGCESVEISYQSGMWTVLNSPSVRWSLSLFGGITLTYQVNTEKKMFSQPPTYLTICKTYYISQIWKRKKEEKTLQSCSRLGVKEFCVFCLVFLSKFLFIEQI